VQSLVVTLTLNPALDLTTSVDCIVPFQKLRCGPMRRDAGGGGINVARVLQRWGCEVLAIHTAGGATGEKLKRLIAQEGLWCEVLPLVADTREDFTVYETQTGRQFRFIEPGAALLAEDVSRCEAALAAIRPAPAFVVASGSLPPGSPADAYARCVAAANAVGAWAVLDASGPPLARALEKHVFLVKPNQRELSDELSARKTARESREASLKLGRRFAELVNGLADSPVIGTDLHYCIAFGAAGAALGLPEDAVALAYLRQSVAGLISACQRLMALGQVAANRIVWNLSPTIGQAASHGTKDEEVWCFSPFPELASMRHGSLETRLFIS